MESNKVAIIIISLLLVLNIFSWVIIYDLDRLHQMEVVFFDVGQGNSALIRTPERHRILIDGGPGSIILEKLAQEIPFWDKRIDLIILTHPHSDHLSGLIDVLGRYNVETILWTGVLSDTELSSSWDSHISNLDVRIAQAGQRIRGSSFYLDILYPIDSLEGLAVDDLNKSSIISRLVSENGSVIFMADALASNEKRIIKISDFCYKNRGYYSICRVMKINSDIIKIGHHGSRTSTLADFLERVSPSIAIISAGKDNYYGHPHKEILELLDNYDIRVLRTDIDGDIRVIIDNKNIDD
ncbi:MAG: MBL fold metallo-hydrolase [Candidatus Pacebacteria bacterium]|nr:MBL fold metallo-hydrolase [Candidatus Paceibacterota bacterium]